MKNSGFQYSLVILQLNTIRKCFGQSNFYHQLNYVSLEKNGRRNNIQKKSLPMQQWFKAKFLEAFRTISFLV